MKIKNISLVVSVLVLLASSVSAKKANVAVAGPQGEQGIQGIQGEKGAQGEQGPAGKPGATGPAGAQGERGIQGLTGAQGERGLQGIQGAKGDKGDKGEQGLQGIQGLKGDQGEKGEQGIQGLQGEAGATAIDGGVIDTEKTSIDIEGATFFIVGNAESKFIGQISLINGVKIKGHKLTFVFESTTEIVDTDKAQVLEKYGKDALAEGLTEANIFLAEPATVVEKKDSVIDTFNAGDTLELVYDGYGWYELSRSNTNLAN